MASTGVRSTYPRCRRSGSPRIADLPRLSNQHLLHDLMRSFFSSLLGIVNQSPSTLRPEARTEWTGFSCARMSRRTSWLLADALLRRCSRGDPRNHRNPSLPWRPGHVAERGRSNAASRRCVLTRQRCTWIAAVRLRLFPEVRKVFRSQVKPRTARIVAGLLPDARLVLVLAGRLFSRRRRGRGR